MNFICQDFKSLDDGDFFIGTFNSGAIFYGMKVKHNTGDGFISLGGAYKDEPNLPTLRYASTISLGGVLKLANKPEIQVGMGMSSIHNVAHDECRGQFGFILQNQEGVYLSVYTSGNGLAVNLNNGDLVAMPNNGYIYKNWKLVIRENDQLISIVEYSLKDGLSFQEGIISLN